MQRVKSCVKVMSLSRHPSCRRKPSDKFAFAVEHRATGISAGDVIVRQETELHFAAFLVFVRAEVAFFKQDLYFRFHLIFVDFVALCDFIQQARHGSKVVLVSGSTGVVVYEAVTRRMVEFASE